MKEEAIFALVTIICLTFLKVMGKVAIQHYYKSLKKKNECQYANHFMKGNITCLSSVSCHLDPFLRIGFNNIVKWKARDPDSSYSGPLAMNVTTTTLGCGGKCKKRRAESAVASGYGQKKDSSKWTGKPCSQATKMRLNLHGGQGDPPTCLQVVTWKGDLLRLKASP